MMIMKGCGGNLRAAAGGDLAPDPRGAADSVDLVAEIEQPPILGAVVDCSAVLHTRTRVRRNHSELRNRMRQDSAHAGTAREVLPLREA